MYKAKTAKLSRQNTPPTLNSLFLLSLSLSRSWNSKSKSYNIIHSTPAPTPITAQFSRLTRRPTAVTRGLYELSPPWAESPPRSLPSSRSSRRSRPLTRWSPPRVVQNLGRRGLSFPRCRLRTTWTCSSFGRAEVTKSWRCTLSTIDPPAPCSILTVMLPIWAKCSNFSSNWATGFASMLWGTFPLFSFNNFLLAWCLVLFSLDVVCINLLSAMILEER